jgi:hypothetical protein
MKKPTPKTKPTPAKSPTPPPEPQVCDSLRAAAGAWQIPISVLKASKASGCPAFVNGRIHREPLMQWLRDNRPKVDEAEKLDIAKADRAALETERIRAQVRLLCAKADLQERLVILRTEAVAEWTRAMSIVQEEYRMLMEPDCYRIACQRARLRVGTLHEETAPQNSCLTNDPFQTTV